MARTATATKEKKAPLPTSPALKIVEVSSGDIKKAIGTEGTKTAMHMLPPSTLRVIPGFNVRVHDNASYKADIDTLKSSIMTEGFYNTKPLSGFIGKDGDSDVVFITDGHRRFEAVLAAIKEGAEITSIPVVLKDSKTSMVDLTIALVKENTGRPLTILENAIVAKRLLTAGLSEADIAKRLGFTDRYVLDLMILISAPKSIRTAVREDKITGTEAIRVCRGCGDDKAGAEAKVAAMIEKAASKGKARATRADSGDEPVKGKKGKATGEDAEGNKVRMASVETKWACNKGQEFDLKEIRHFKNLFGDNDWFTPSETKTGWATAVEDVEFKAVVRRPKKEEAPETKEEVAAEEVTSEEAVAETGDL